MWMLDIGTQAAFLEHTRCADNYVHIAAQVLSDHGATLESAGITDRSMLTVRPA
jgi:hypothetical protein